jgi:hypothetical protein
MTLRRIEHFSTEWSRLFECQPFLEVSLCGFDCTEPHGVDDRTGGFQMSKHKCAV